MKGILDTCTLAEIRRPEGSQSVKAFVAEFDDADLFLSVISVGEIVKGISLLEAGKKKRALTSWLTQLENLLRLLTGDPLRFAPRALSHATPHPAISWRPNVNWISSYFTA